MSETKTEIPFWLKLNLTVEEAAKYSGIGEKNIRNLLKEKACPFLFMVGNKHLVKRHEFEKFIESKHYI
ncbi:excisionase [Lachnospira eligens]|uniref:excisionase n=1 Tax=Lachnospira eligens TaxID=39485 RepID=UPI00155DC565|nr:excisionase [Lachnospira eligens]